MGNGGGSIAPTATVAKPCSLKRLINFLRSPLADFLLESFFSTFFRQSISEIAANDRARRCHERVVRPPFAMMRGQRE